jgi:hypothetical protein
LKAVGIQLAFGVSPAVTPVTHPLQIFFQTKTGNCVRLTQPISRAVCVPFAILLREPFRKKRSWKGKGCISILMSVLTGKINELNEDIIQKWKVYLNFLA